MLGQIVFAEVYYFIYRFFLGLLERICGFFEILAGTRPVYTDGKPLFLLDILFRQGAVSFAFWAVTLFGMVLAVFLSIFNVTTKTFTLNGGNGVGEAVKHIGKVMLIFLLTPLMFMSFLSVSSTILNVTDNLFIERYEANLPGYVFSMTTLVAGRRNIGFGRVDDHIRKPYITGEKRFDNFETVNRDFHLQLIDTQSGVFMSIALICVFLVIFMLLILRIFMLMLLYILSPLFVASMAMGNKEIYQKWFNAFIARIFSAFSLVLSYKIILYLVIPFITGNIRFSHDPIADVVLKFLFVFGAVYGAYKSAGMLTEMLNPGAESDEAIVMATTKKIAIAGAKIAWEAAKAILKGLFTLATAGAGLGAAALETIGGAAKNVAKETAKKAVKDVAKTAVKGMQGSDK